MNTSGTLKESKETERFSVLIEAWNGFNQLKSNKLDLDKDKLQHLVKYYFQHVNQQIRPHVKPSSTNRINIFKICSATELAIMRYEPIKIRNSKSRKKVTSEFAFYTSLYILLLRFEFTTQSLSKFLNRTEIKYFVQEHKKYLQKVNYSTNNPVFSNAETWQLFYYLICSCNNMEPVNYDH